MLKLDLDSVGEQCLTAASLPQIKIFFSDDKPHPQKQKQERKIGNRRKTTVAVLTYKREKEIFPSVSRRQRALERRKLTLRKDSSLAERSDSNLNQDISLDDSS